MGARRRGRRVPCARGAKHAWRNRSTEPAVSLLVTTAKLGRFLRDVGTRVAPGTAPTGAAPAPEALERFLAVAERYGYWNATPEENAHLGIPVPSAAGR